MCIRKKKNPKLSNNQVQNFIKHIIFFFFSLISMKHGYSTNGVIPVLSAFWVLVPLRYCCLCNPVYPKLNFFFLNNHFSFFFFLFSFGYVTKIDKSSGNINFRYNYMVLHFFYLLFWILVCNLKTI
jgi:hypothetical protein